MKKLPLIFIFLFISLALAGMGSAKQPVQATIDTGTDGFLIEYIKDDIIQVNQDFEYHFHVYNLTNGVLMSNGSGINCKGHMHNQKGMVVQEMDAEPSNGGWYFNVSAGNFSQIGLFSYQVHCNDSVKGGFVSGTITVTATGETSDEAQATIYLGLLIVAILLACACIFITYSINPKDEMDFGGILRVNWNKYIKYFMFYVSYLFVWVVLFFSWQTAYNFLLSAEFFVQILRTIYITMTISLLPMFIATFLFAMIKWLTDLKINKIAERGLKPR